MKKYIFIALAFLSLSAFTAVNTIWKNDAPHSQLLFTVSHLGINEVSGSFNDFAASVNASKADFSDAVFELNAKTASVDTRVEARDNHLKSADFFDAEKFPAITFKSTAIKRIAKDKYSLTGNLNMHGISKPVTLQLLYKGSTENPMNKKNTAGFQISGTVKRSDFGIGAKFPAAMVGDVVSIKANGEFIQ